MKIYRILALFVVILFLTNFIQATIIHDVDNDGIGSDVDNCPLDYNPLQEDSNHNGIGNICDPNPGVIITDPVIIIDDQTDTTHSKSKVRIIPSCEPDWRCGGFSECNDDRMKIRICYDANECEGGYNKPAEIVGCEQLNSTEIKAIKLPAMGTNDFVNSGIGIIALLVLICIAFTWIMLAGKRPRQHNNSFKQE